MGFDYKTFIKNMLDLNRPPLFFESVEKLSDNKSVEKY